MKRIHTFAAAAALLFLSANLADAQKMKPAGMPATAKAHMTKADKNAMKDAHEATKDAHEAAKDARKADERAEKSAKDALKDQPKALLKGVKLSKEEKASVKAIEKKNHEQMEALEKQAKAAEKAGAPMKDLAQRLNALREQERTELRAALSREQQVRFDANVASVSSKH